MVTSTDPSADRSFKKAIWVYSTRTGAQPGEDLPDPPSFIKVAEDGTTNYPPNLGNSDETALDVEWAHAIAPGAKIILVESKGLVVQTNNGPVDPTDWLTAVQTAESMGTRR